MTLQKNTCSPRRQPRSSGATIKWCNYVGTLNFGGIVDTTGGTLVCKGDPALNRITKYIAQMPCSDFKASTIYIRIKEAKGYTVFSPFVVPTLTKMDKWECHVGLSYMRWIAECCGLRTQVTIFVPTGSNTLLQDIQVTNLGGAPRKWTSSRFMNSATSKPKSSSRTPTGSRRP